MRILFYGALVAAVIIVAVIILMGYQLISTRIKTGAGTTQQLHIEDLPVEYWNKLAQQKIFFGHCSVGNNIIDGVRELCKQYDCIKLNIVETSDPRDFDKPILGHSIIGQNGNPGSKISDFQKIIRGGLGDRVDIAFFKFCYVDIKNNSDPSEIFRQYNEAVGQLSQVYPKTRFWHLTVPICGHDKNPKTAIKSSLKALLGRKTWLDDNMKRQQYNTLLKDAHSQKHDVFDLACAETTNAQGLRCYVLGKGKEQVCVLLSEYTSDGGHLNTQGKKAVAEQFLITLAQLANEL